MSSKDDELEVDSEGMHLNSPYKVSFDFHLDRRDDRDDKEVDKSLESEDAVCELHKTLDNR